MSNRDLIVIGASAGGIEALQELCAALPSDLNAAILIVMHISPYSDGLLPRVLNRVTDLNVDHPDDGEVIQKGNIYIAPPDSHMIVDRGRLRIVHGPRENRNRPAIDPTFRSAAVAYGRRVIGIVLTGLLDDGTAGAMVIRAHGGGVIVQDPRTALFPSMPSSALERVPDAYVATLDAIPGLLKTLLTEELELLPHETEARPTDPTAEEETRLSEVDMSDVQNEIHPGKPSEFACPECGGVLWEIEQGGLLRFRCRVGHAYTARHLRAEHRHAVETALWAALRALEESVSLYRRMAARTAKHEHTHRIFEERADTAEENVKTLRDFLLHVGTPEDADEARPAA